MINRDKEEYSAKYIPNNTISGCVNMLYKRVKYKHARSHIFFVYQWYACRANSILGCSYSNEDVGSISSFIASCIYNVQGVFDSNKNKICKKCYNNYY